MSDRPSILWVTEEPPDRGAGGGNIRQANLVIELARRFDIDLLVAGEVTDQAVRSAAREVIEVPVPGAAPAPSRLSAVRTLLLDRQPLGVAAAERVRAALRPHVLRSSPGHDLALVHHATLAGLLPDVRGALPVAHLFHVGSAASAQAAGLAERLPTRALLRAEAVAARRIEQRLVEDASALVLCSQEDAAALPLDRPGTGPVVIAPNGVDLARFGPRPTPGTARVLFFGSLDFPPNVDGIRWFVDDIWPDVLSRVPGAELCVVGRRPPAEVLSLAGRPGVRVEGDVPDSVPWYDSSDVVVVPLRIGTGTRLKALEAMAAARPVVGTTIGLEGIQLDRAAQQGAPAAVVADTEPAMSAAVVRALTDRAHAADLASAGRAHVERHYGWAAIADDLADALAGLAASPPKQAS